MRHLHPDLMMAPGSKMNLGKRISKDIPGFCHPLLLHFPVGQNPK